MARAETPHLPGPGDLASGPDASRSDPDAQRDRPYLEPLIGSLLIVSAIVLPALFGSAYWVHNFTVVSLFVSVAVLQNLLLSDAGQVSFGQGAVFGAGAYMTGIISGLWGHSYVVGFIGGVGAALAMGLLFAIPALRVQSFYLGFVTLSAALVFPEMLVAFSSVTNGINGIARPVPELTQPLVGGLSGISFIATGPACACLFGHAHFRRTALGRRMRVSAVSPEAAMTLGWSPGLLRFIAFTIASVVTGIAGALYVVPIGFVSPYAFRVDLSIFFFFSVIIGGSGRLLGPVVGTAILYLVPNALLADLASYRLLAYGVVALIIMLVFPDGVIGTLEKLLRQYRARSSSIDFRSVLADTSSAPSRDGEALGIEITGVRKAYGKMVALNDVSVGIAPGRIHAIVGPNGSGKTTLLNVISGLVRVDRGQVMLGGEDTTRQPTYRTARLGLGRTFQTPRVFEEMSIWDNLQIGADARLGDGASWLLGALSPHRAAWQAQMPDALAHAQRRLLEVLRVLAMDARVVLLDEPAAGLSADERRNLAALLRMLRDTMGRTVVLIEHDLHLVWLVADRITVLDAGEVIAEGAPKEILSDSRVRSLFAGAPPGASANHA